MKTPVASQICPFLLLKSNQTLSFAPLLTNNTPSYLLVNKKACRNRQAFPLLSIFFEDGVKYRFQVYPLPFRPHPCGASRHEQVITADTCTYHLLFQRLRRLEDAVLQILFLFHRQTVFRKDNETNRFSMQKEGIFSDFLEPGEVVAVLKVVRVLFRETCLTLE